MSDAERRARAVARSRTMTLRKARLGEPDRDLSPVFGADAISLATQLTVESWALAGVDVPRIPRDEWPYRFVSRVRPS